MDSSSAGSKRPVDTGERLIPGVHPDSINDAQHLARYELAARLAPGRRVLDDGCGVGYGAAMIKRAGAQFVVGIDLDAETIAWATETYGELADFYVADMLALPFEQRFFDFVACFEAIEHVSDPELALDQIKRVLTEDGLLAISSPNRGRYTEGNRFHLNEMTSGEFELLLSSRFENVRMLRQHMHLATAIVDDEALGAEGPGVAHEAELRRLAPGAPGEEIFSVAIAGDRPLPEVPNTVMLTEGQSMLAWTHSAASWRERAIEAEAVVQRTATSVQQIYFERDHAVEELEHLKLKRGLRR